MGLTYYRVVNADLSSVAESAKSWKTVGDDFDALLYNYRRHVRKPLEARENWSGKAAEAYTGSSNTTAREMEQARDYAWSISRLLHDAHDSLVRCQNKVKAARDVALEAKMRVDADGSWTFDKSKLTTEELNSYLDPIEGVAWRMKESETTDHIAGIVGETSRVDSSVEKSLRSALDSGNESSGNAVQLANSSGDGKVNIAPGPMPDVRSEKKPQRYQEVIGALSYRSFIEGGKLMTHGKFSEGFDKAMEGAPYLAAGYGADKAGKFNPGRHRKPSFMNKLGTAGAKVLDWPLGVAATIFDYSTDFTGKEKLWEW